MRGMTPPPRNAGKEPKQIPFHRAYKQRGCFSEHSWRCNTHSHTHTHTHTHTQFFWHHGDVKMKNGKQGGSWAKADSLTLAILFLTLLYFQPCMETTRLASEICMTKVQVLIRVNCCVIQDSGRLGHALIAG